MTDFNTDALGEGPIILGAATSAADIYAAMVAAWDLDMPAFLARHPNVRRLCSQVSADPTIAEIWKRHELAVSANP